VVAAPPPASARTAPCPRCGTPYVGNFCPKCGLPAAYLAAPYYRPPSPGRKFLSVLWTLAVVGFLLLVALNLVGLYYGATFVVPGIQGLSRGASANPGLDTGSADWTFVSTWGNAVGSAPGSGGNPGPYLATSLPPGVGVIGMWSQAVGFSGSAPFAAIFRLDLFVGTVGTMSGRVVVALDSTPGPPDFSNDSIARTVLWVNGSVPWTTSPTIDLSDRVTTPGTYFLKVAILATVTGSTTTVGFDNLHLIWATDAAVVLWLPLPIIPEGLLVTQDSNVFFSYYILLIAAITAAALYYTLRERSLIAAAFTAPLEAIGKRLRSMSGWVAVAQTWMAVTFVQVAIIYLMLATGQEPTTPIEQTSQNTWVLLFDLADASVYEELVFRLLLIGVPMALGSLAINVMRPPTASRSAKHSLRYLLGGRLRRESSRGALLAAWILLLASSALFGAAHAPGWGWWKVVPAMVAGLGFGYLFLRHGIGAAILAHFATDYLSVLPWEGVGASSADLVSLLFLSLALIGSGFFVWYILYAGEQLRDLWARFSAHPIRQAAPVAPASAPYLPPQTWGPLPPNQGPPPAYTGPPSGTWTAVPEPPPTRRDPGTIPPGYAPRYRMPPYGYPPVRFQCPACGWIEAKYESGRFTCLRCGRMA